MEDCFSFFVEEIPACARRGFVEFLQAKKSTKQMQVLSNLGVFMIRSIHPKVMVFNSVYFKLNRTAAKVNPRAGHHVNSFLS